MSNSEKEESLGAIFLESDPVKVLEDWSRRDEIASIAKVPPPLSISESQKLGATLHSIVDDIISGLSGASPSADTHDGVLRIKDELAPWLSAELKRKALEKHYSSEKEIDPEELNSEIMSKAMLDLEPVLRPALSEGAYFPLVSDLKARTVRARSLKLESGKGRGRYPMDRATAARIALTVFEHEKARMNFNSDLKTIEHLEPLGLILGPNEPKRIRDRVGQYYGKAGLKEVTIVGKLAGSKKNKSEPFDLYSEAELRNVSKALKGAEQKITE